MARGLLAQAELASSWELSAAGFMVAVWLYWVSTYTDGAVAELGGALYILVIGGPIAVAAITAVHRLRPEPATRLGTLSVDLAVLLSLALAPLLLIYAVDFFKALNLSGAGNVVGFLLDVVASAVLALLIAAWGVGEVGVARKLVPAGTGTIGEPRHGGAPGSDAPPPAQ